MEKQRFQRLFPHLSKEIESEASNVTVTYRKGRQGSRANVEGGAWAGYDPDVTDFIRRCKTPHQAEEIIDYMEKRGEISTARAEELRRQLKREGLESFGPRKELDFYHRED